MKLGEEGWRYLYPQHVLEQAKREEEDEKGGKTRRSRRSPRKNGNTEPTPYAILRESDQAEFRVGDIVTVESNDDEVPYIGLIGEFSFGADELMYVKLLWFTRPEDLRKKDKVDSEPHEVFASLDDDHNVLDVIIESVQVLSRDDFLKEYPDGKVPADLKNRVFFCRRALSASVSRDDRFNWAQIYKERDTNIDEMVEAIKESVNEPVTPGKKQQRAKRSREEDDVDNTRKKLRFANDQDDDDDVGLEDMEEIGENSAKKAKADDSDEEFYDAPENVDEEEEEEEEEEGGIEESEDGSEEEELVETKKKSPSKKGKSALVKSIPAPRAPRTKNPGATPVKKQRVPRNGRMFVKAPLKSAALPDRGESPYKNSNPPQSPHKSARDKLHVASIPESLPCRDDEFSQIFLALESAISSASGSCIYVSGTPGTGKTATVREAVEQLKLRCDEGELRNFSFLEINGMKLITPQDAYEILWEEVSGGQRVSASNAMVLLEQRFKEKDKGRTPIVVLMDELDQLVTKNQTVMYNFFNWPTFANSQLIVVAVANTMDLPERMLSNKISSRLGLTRIQFPGYTHDQLKQIIETRLEDIPGSVVDQDAVEFAARKIASVSGDARRALDICRRAVELAQPETIEPEITPQTQVKINHIKQAINESINSPLYTYLKGLSMASKIFLCAVLTRVRRSGLIDNSLSDVLEETERLIRLSPDAAKLNSILFTTNVRMAGFQKALAELVEGGILVQQSMRGERSANVRLATGEEDIKSALLDDEDVAGML